MELSVLGVVVLAARARAQGGLPAAAELRVFRGRGQVVDELEREEVAALVDEHLEPVERPAGEALDERLADDRIELAALEDERAQVVDGVLELSLPRGIAGREACEHVEQLAFPDDAAQLIIVEADEVLVGDGGRAGARPDDARVRSRAAAEVDRLGHDRRHLELDPRARRRLRRIGEDEPAELRHLHRAVLVVHADLGVEALEVGRQLDGERHAPAGARARQEDRSALLHRDRRREERHRQLLHVRHFAELLVEGTPADCRDGAFLVGPDRDRDLVDGARPKCDLQRLFGLGGIRHPDEDPARPGGGRRLGLLAAVRLCQLRLGHWRRRRRRSGSCRFGGRLCHFGGRRRHEHVVDQVGRRRELGRLRLVAGRRQRRLARSRPSSRRPR